MIILGGIPPVPLAAVALALVIAGQRLVLMERSQFGDGQFSINKLPEREQEARWVCDTG